MPPLGGRIEAAPRRAGRSRSRAAASQDVTIVVGAILAVRTFQQMFVNVPPHVGTARVVPNEHVGFGVI